MAVSLGCVACKRRRRQAHEGGEVPSGAAQWTAVVAAAASAVAAAKASASSSHKNSTKRARHIERIALAQAGKVLRISETVCDAGCLQPWNVLGCARRRQTSKAARPRSPSPLKFYAEESPRASASGRINSPHLLGASSGLGSILSAFAADAEAQGVRSRTSPSTASLGGAAAHPPRLHLPKSTINAYRSPVLSHGLFPSRVNSQTDHSSLKPSRKMHRAFKPQRRARKNTCHADPKLDDGSTLLQLLQSPGVLPPTNGQVQRKNHLMTTVQSAARAAQPAASTRPQLKAPALSARNRHATDMKK